MWNGHSVIHASRLAVRTNHKMNGSSIYSIYHCRIVQLVRPNIIVGHNNEQALSWPEKERFNEL